MADVAQEGLAAAGPAGRRALATLALAALLAAVAFAAWQAAFSTFASYDDEGYILVSLRSYLSGGQLYDDVYSQYGPAFHILVGGLHRVTGWPLDHRTIRIKTVAVLTLAALAAAVVVWRLARRAAPAVIAAAVTFLHLEKLVAEPAHPQEVCVLLTAGLLLLATLLDSRPRPGVWAAMGCCAGLLAMVKPNVGAVAALGLLAAAALELPGSPAGTTVRRVVVAGGVAAPLALVGRHLLALPGLGLATAAACGLAACVLVAGAPGGGRTATWTPCGGLALGTTATTAAVAALALATCTSVRGLAYGLVGQHLRFAERFFEIPQLPAVAPLVAAAGLAAAWWLAARAGPTPAWLPVAKLAAGTTLLVVVLVGSLVAAAEPLFSGLQDPTFAGLLAGVGPALAFLLVAPPRGGWTQAQRRPRVVLALVAVVHPLLAFPLGGSQLATGTLWLVAVATLLLADGAGEVHPAPWGRSLTALTATAAVAVVVLHGVSRWQVRAGLEPVEFRGCRGMRLPPGQLALLRWAVAELPRHGETFLAVPQARNSLYLWTGLRPPTTLNATYWPIMLSPEEQRRVMTAIASRRVAVLWDTADGASEARFPAQDFPLVAYLRREYVPVRELGPFQVRVRRAPGGGTVAGGGEVGGGR